MNELCGDILVSRSCFWSSSIHCRISKLRRNALEEMYFLLQFIIQEQKLRKLI